MSEWPEDWFRGGAGQGGSPASGASHDPTVQVPAGPAGAASGPAAGSPAGNWPAQPPPRSGGPGPGVVGRGAGPASPPGSDDVIRTGFGRGGLRLPRPGGLRTWLRPRRIAAVLGVLVCLILVAVIGLYFFFDSKLHRQDVLVNYSGRPAASAGTNWLIAGSDSRQGLSRKEEHKLATGVGIGGKRSDTIMILHMSPGGQRPLLISLPRDSYVPIPGHGMNKINAAYAFGGPKLLAETVQNVTGLRIQHFMEIGFGGFVNVVNSVGGVRMCIPQTLHDPAAGLRLRKGCQTLSGGQALGYVRTRHLYAQQDLQRVQDQRVFLHALLSKMTSPGVYLNPFSALPAASGVTGTLTVDQGTHLIQLVKVAFAMRDPLTTTVPIANPGLLTPVGDAVEWNRTEALQLFNDLKAGRPVPKSLLTGSKTG
jgi:LCP family protein required for cell wall assembly